MKYIWIILSFVATIIFGCEESEAEMFKDQLILTGRSYYVSQEGNDISGDGSELRPWKSVGAALATPHLGSGDTLRISAGVFVEDVHLQVPAGLNIIGAGSGVTIIRGSNGLYYHPESPGFATDKFLLILSSAVKNDLGQTLAGFTINGDSKRLHGGIYVYNRDDIHIRDVEIEKVNFSGIWLWNVANSTIRDVVLNNCSWGDVSYSSGALNIGNLQNVVIENAYIDENNGFGIKAIGPDSSNYFEKLVILDSHITVNPESKWNNGLSPNIAIEFWQSELSGCAIYNCYLDNVVSLVNDENTPPQEGKSMHIHHNIFDLSARAKGSGYGVELTMHNVEISHNYFVGGAYGIVNWAGRKQNWSIHHNVFKDIYGTYPGDILRSERLGIKDVQFFNNTIELKHGEEVNIVGVYGGESHGITVNNNLFFTVGVSEMQPQKGKVVHLAKGAVVSELRVENNLLHHIDPGHTGEIFKNNIVGLDPLITGTGQRPHPYYTPRRDSPLIDAGIDVGYSFKGLKPDIGAYEYGED